MTEAPSMLEQMADAISEAAFEAALCEPGQGISLEEARIVARAALQAIREQPPEIGYFQTIADAHRVSPQRAWADMIDAILGEQD